MKLKQKLLAALVAVGFASGAYAAVDNSVGGNGSLILGVINSSAQVSALFDLGYNLDTFLPGAVSGASPAVPNEMWNLSTDANYAAAWNTFVAAAAAAPTPSVSRYVVFAGDSLGTAAGEDRFLSTSSSNLAVAANRPTVAQLLNWVGASGGSNVDLFVNNSNSLGNHSLVADGSNFASAAANPNAFLGANTAFGTGRFSNVGPFISTGDVNTNLSFARLATTSGNPGITRAATTIYGNALGNSTFFLNSTTGVLTFTTPVPEADTWAMFAVGLLAVGAIARRRLQS